MARELCSVPFSCTGCKGTATNVNAGACNTRRHRCFLLEETVKICLAFTVRERNCCDRGLHVFAECSLLAVSRRQVDTAPSMQGRDGGMQPSSTVLGTAASPWAGFARPAAVMSLSCCLFDRKTENDTHKQAEIWTCRAVFSVNRLLECLALLADAIERSASSCTERRCRKDVHLPSRAYNALSSQDSLNLLPMRRKAETYAKCRASIAPTQDLHLKVHSLTAHICNTIHKPPADTSRFCTLHIYYAQHDYAVERFGITAVCLSAAQSVLRLQSKLLKQCDTHA